MKHSVILSIIVFILLTTGVRATESDGADSTQSIFYGLYGTYPILTEEKKSELTERKKEVEKEIKILEDSILAISENISKIHKTDTVAVRKHMIIFRGLFTIPTLTEAEKQKKKKLEPLKKELLEVQKNTRDLEQELVEINALLKRNEIYLEKRIFWGFVVWEVEK